MELLVWIVLGTLELVFSQGRVKEGDDPRDVAKKDLEKLQGTWYRVSTETEECSHVEEIEGWGSIYEGDTLTIKIKDEVRRAIVTLDPTRTPKAMNTWELDGPFQGETVPGIYLLEGDSLKICFALPGEKRPTEFTTKSGTGFLVVVCKRQKP